MKVGQKLEHVKVKEVNYFDGVPILTARANLVASEVINYATIKPGQYVTGKVHEVLKDKDCLKIKISDFVYGYLHLEHMGENPLKSIPPKFAEVGRELKLRVF